MILTGLGIVYLSKIRPKIKVVIILAYAFMFISYLDIYYVHYSRHWSDSWQFGYKQMVEYVNTIKDKYDRIYITQSLGRPHTYVLFYSKYDPPKYWQTRDAGGDAFGFTYTNSFDKYYFTDPDLTKKGNQKWLFVTKPDGVSPGTPVLQTIYDLNHQPVFEIVEL
jgi:hypothetical protein